MADVNEVALDRDVNAWAECVECGRLLKANEHDGRCVDCAGLVDPEAYPTERDRLSWAAGHVAAMFKMLARHDDDAAWHAQRAAHHYHEAGVARG